MPIRSLVTSFPRCVIDTKNEPARRDQLPVSLYIFNSRLLPARVISNHDDEIVVIFATLIQICSLPIIETRKRFSNGCSTQERGKGKLSIYTFDVRVEDKSCWTHELTRTSNRRHRRLHMRTETSFEADNSICNKSQLMSSWPSALSVVPGKQSDYKMVFQSRTRSDTIIIIASYQDMKYSVYAEWRLLYRLFI